MSWCSSSARGNYPEILVQILITMCLIKIMDNKKFYLGLAFDVTEAGLCPAVHSRSSCNVGLDDGPPRFLRWFLGAVDPEAVIW